MASIQRLKKELSYVTTELLFGCYVAEISNPKVSIDDITKIAKEVTNLHGQTTTKINEYKRAKNEHKNARKYFGQIRTDLVQSTKQIVEQIESLRK